MSKETAMVGRIFGRLTVVSFDHRNDQYEKVWLCHCECGNTSLVTAGHLKHGTTRSCGCLRMELAKKVKHGHARDSTKTYHTWQQMHDRCRNQNKDSFKYYGGRGISVCERWKKFENFLADMGERPDGMSIERKDNDGNYEWSNCKWATPKEQANNRRKRRTA